MRPNSYKPPSVRLAWLCDKGLVRTAYKDALLVQKRSNVLSEGYETGTSDVELSSDPLFLGVAEDCGGGGHRDDIGKDILRNIANAVSSTESPRKDEELGAIIRDANRYQTDKSNRRVDRATLTIALVDDRQAIIAQVGDTRCYLYRSSKLMRVMMDQSIVAQMIRSGQITAEEAQYGMQNGVTIATFSRQAIDWLLLLTDGIWKFVDGELIEETVREANSPLAVVTRLKSHAIKNGGHDDLSIITAQFSNP